VGAAQLRPDLLPRIDVLGQKVAEYSPAEHLLAIGVRQPIWGQRKISIDRYRVRLHDRKIPGSEYTNLAVARVEAANEMCSQSPKVKAGELVVRLASVTLGLVVGEKLVG
jgi:hypothetical protein